MNEAEWQTRKKRIDVRLCSFNPAWQIIPWSAGLDSSKLSGHAVTEYPTENGPADYALFVDGILLGIIEAKKVTVNPQNVLEQAKRYSRGAADGPGNWNGFRVPFLYATNGEIIWRLDVRLDQPVSRPLANFHTAAALEEKFALDDSRSRQWLLDTPPEGITRLRPYQVASIFATESAMLDTATGKEHRDELEDERQFPSEDIERRITAPQSNRQIIEEIAQHAYAHEKETGHFPKILIFAVNDIAHTSHADQLVKTCREVFGQGDDFVQKITGNPNVDRPLHSLSASIGERVRVRCQSRIRPSCRIREFRNRPHPKVVVTVEVPSPAGAGEGGRRPGEGCGAKDIPALEFIVFLRPVKSRILWVQMLGRGTRKCPEINKTKFVVFDCFDGTLIQYFRNVFSFGIEPPSRVPLTLPEGINLRNEV